MCQMYVKTAFLDGELEEEVFMEILDRVNNPEGMILTKVCKLRKSFYG